MRMCKAENWCKTCSPTLKQSSENNGIGANYHFAVNSQDLSKATEDPRTVNLSGRNNRRGKEEIERFHHNTSNTHLMT